MVVNRGLDATKRWLFLCLAVAALTLLWGIKKDLPLNPETDERTFVANALRMANTGSLHPGWFGNPGSTTMYPLALLYSQWYTVTRGEALLHANLTLPTAMEEYAAEYYFVGRLLSVIYALLTIPFVYLVGKEALNRQVGIGGVWLYALYSLPVFFAQWIRTDSGALFFGMVSLWRLLLLYELPTRRNQLLAGVAIGLAISSRYFLLALLPALFLAELLAFRADINTAARRKQIISGTILSLVAIVVTFVVANPYFFLDYQTVIQSLQFEARTNQLGHDGQTAIENLLWYLTIGIPQAMTWPQALLAAAGLLAVVWRRQSKPLILLAFAAVFLAGISLGTLYWDRWVIQLLPILAIFVAFVVQTLVATFSRRWQLDVTAERKLFVCGIFLVAAWPAVTLMIDTIQKTGASTRILAREWAMESLPPDSKLINDRYTANLVGAGFENFEQSWSPPDHSLGEYISQDYDFIFINERLYQFILAEPERYTNRLVFYDELFARGRLVKEFRPSLFHDGPTILVYELPGS